jgi:hypothetical protein
MSEQKNSDLSEKRFGWPLPRRKQCFEDLTIEAKQNASESYRIESFKGSPVSLQILRVDVNLPKYRIANGRTSSIQEEWVTQYGKAEGFFVDGDPELYELQEAQHEILENMIGEKGLHEKFKDTSNIQVEPLLLDENGFAINGNRRLCCWRNLYRQDPKKYSHFSHVDVVVLPKCEDRELDKLESRLQIEKDIRSDYSWHAEAKMFKEKQRRFGYTTVELSKQYRKPKKEIEVLFNIRELGAEYLESRNKKNMWSSLSETEHTFKTLNKTMKEQKNVADREILKELAFTYIDDPEAAGGRLYSFIPKLGKHLPLVLQRLKDGISVKVSESVDDEAKKAFGANTNLDTPTHGLALIAQIHSSPAELTKAHDIIVNTLESEKERVKEKEKSKYLLDNIQKSRTALADAINLGMIPEAELEGAEAQLEGIEAAVRNIRNFIKLRNM